MSIKKVFISYSHDSDEHRQGVLALSQRLRQDGLETCLDRYENGSPRQGWPRWMLDQIDAANFVLVVCTETYYRRFRRHEEPGKGRGVDWEGALITQEIYDGRSKTLKSDLAEPPSWKPRLTAERGDYAAVWQEMLSGYFLGKISQRRLTADLLDPSRDFENSALGRSSESRQGFLTEWYFYDALLQSVRRDRSSRTDRFRSDLEEAVDLKQRDYIEFMFAKSLLKRIERGEDPAPQLTVREKGNAAVVAAGHL